MKQLLTFFGLSYFISWFIWLPLYLPSLGFASLPSIPFNHAIGGLGPLLASFLTSLIFEKKEGVINLLSQCIQLKLTRYFTIALFSPFLLLGVAALLNYFVNNTALNLTGLFHSKEFPEWQFLTLFCYNLLFFGFGEEAGWRGFALPRLQRKMNALSSSILLTLFWALWHLPLFFYREGYITMHPLEMIGWLFSLLTGSVLLTWLYNSSRGSILICAVFHATIDIAFTSDISNRNLANYMGFLITVCGIVILLILKPKNLSSIQRTQHV